MRGGAARYQCSSSPPNRSLYRRRPRLGPARLRSEEHTSELQSQSNLVCRLLLEKKKKHILTINQVCIKTPEHVKLLMFTFNAADHLFGYVDTRDVSVPQHRTVA